VIPASDPVFDESSIAILRENSSRFVRPRWLATSGRRACDCSQPLELETAVLGDNDCFANPVPADVMMDGRKIAGAAQRRARRGLLQQGSIQGITMKTAN